MVEDPTPSALSDFTDIRTFSRLPQCCSYFTWTCKAQKVNQQLSTRVARNFCPTLSFWRLWQRFLCRQLQWLHLNHVCQYGWWEQRTLRFVLLSPLVTTTIAVIAYNLFFQKWQFGIMFVPDSLGYFVSTNFFAMLAHRVGSMHMAIVSLFVVGISCIWVSFFLNQIDISN